MKRHKKLKIAGFVLAVLLILSGADMAVYVNDYYHASPQALQATESTDTVTVTGKEGKTLVFAPEEPKAGFIFYPGGKVEYESYAPLMQALAKNNILCVLVHMPYNLAVLDVDAADGIRDKFPDIEKWYIGGHSLGGSMAASYVAEHTGEFDGLVLLAAYSTADLQESGLQVISIYGTEDGVLNMDKYEKYKGNLPFDVIEEKIDGGCHAYFGSYGEQDGDGKAVITSKEQITRTAEIIAGSLK